MFTVKFDTTQFSKIMKNAISYSMGFFEGIEANRIAFNKELGEFAKEALYKYLDAKARAGAIHHVYEPNAAGSAGGRLYEFNVIATASSINFVGSFLPSSGTPSMGGEPLVDRANIMENGISITIEPRGDGPLAFQDGGEMVFTTTAIYIAHPGGDGAAGSFGNAVEDFFNNFFTNAMLAPLLAKLQTPNEFESNFPAGAMGGGRTLGIRTGKSYLDVIGVIE